MASSLWFVLSLMVGIPGLRDGETPFPTKEFLATSAIMTIPVAILLFILARVFWKGKYMGLVAGYTEKGIADPARLGRLMGRMLAGLGAYMLVFPLTVRAWGLPAFIAFVFVVVGFGIAILVGTAWYEKG